MPEGDSLLAHRTEEHLDPGAGEVRRVPTVYHIPVCPFSQRLEILLTLKGCRDLVDFHVVDITRPRQGWLLEKTQGTTALPVLETEGGGIIKESMVILGYLEDLFPEPAVTQRDPYRRAVEGMMTAMEGEFSAWGYRYVLNQDHGERDAFRRGMLERYARLDEFLRRHNPEGTFLFERFGLAETVFTPFFMRFWFLEYYEGFDLPDGGRYDRVRGWREACLAHQAAQQVTREQIVKVYYDYAKGAGNGAPVPGREISSFVFDPDWTSRPWPPKDKYGHDATDRELGLVP